MLGKGIQSGADSGSMARAARHSPSASACLLHPIQGRGENQVGADIAGIKLYCLVQRRDGTIIVPGGTEAQSPQIGEERPSFGCNREAEAKAVAAQSNCFWSANQLPRLA
jgi:hypothetical protein